MKDIERKGNEAAMNASIVWAQEQAARAPQAFPDNAVVRGDGTLVGSDQRGAQLRRVSPGHSK